MLEPEMISQLGAPVNAIQRQHMGRYLFRRHDPVTQQQHWIKLQQQGIHAECEQSFLHELQCYRDIDRLSQARGSSILLDFEVVDLAQHLGIDQDSGFYPQGLRIMDSTALFAAPPMHLDHVLQVLFQSLACLEQLHALGYLHADLKPEHFRQQHRRCCLIDFEQALRIDQAKASAVTATPRYMAPELFHGQAKSIQTEIYALGVIWSAWIGQQRIQQSDYLAWAKWHCQDFQLQLPGEYADLEPVLLAMLAKHCSARYAHIREIKQALTAFL